MSIEAHTFRIALANLRYPGSPDESVRLAVDAIARAAEQRAQLVCFPECYVPGYRVPGRANPAPDAGFLERAWRAVAGAARESGLTVLLGTERVTEAGLLNSVCVIGPDGAIAGFQDKGQLDPSEEATYAFGSGRKLFRAGPLSFGIAICHEGWRYPETFRAAARAGAQVMFHPHFHEAEPGAPAPRHYADPANSFHEKAMLCRAAENTCYVASVNCAIPDSLSTSAVVRPDGTLLCYQPYGKEGLLLADLDLTAATRLLAQRSRPEAHRILS